jgi:putative hydrolase of the HAD superfamily
VIHRTCGVDCREALANGAAYPGEVCGDVLAIVRAARQRVPVGLITNATSRLDDHLRQLELSEEVDAVFNSSAMGVAKPDPRIFLQACAQLGAEPTQTVFVDDTAGHVAAACAIGIRGHLFTTADALRPVLREEGILA